MAEQKERNEREGETALEGGKRGLKKERESF